MILFFLILASHLNAFATETVQIPLLEDFAKERIVTVPLQPLKRVVVYHYQVFESWINTSLEISQDQQVNEKLKSAIHHGLGIAGDGFYAAIDVSASRRFGKEDFILLELELRNGSRLLDVAQKSTLPDSVYNEICSLRCCVKELKEIFSFGSVFYISESNQNPGFDEFYSGCLDIRNRLLSNLNMGGIIYDWEATQSSKICSKKRLERAVLITSEDALDFSKLKFYTSTTESNSDSRRLGVLYRTLKPYYSDLLEAKGLNLWPSFAVTEEEQEQAFAWARESWLGCPEK